MAIRTYNFTFDVKRPIMPEPVFIRQNDSTGATLINVHLVDNGMPVTINGDLEFRAMTADSQNVIADTTGFSNIDIDKGAFSYALPNQLSMTPGKIRIAYFMMVDASGNASTLSFVIFVKPAADLTPSGAKNYISIIDGLIKVFNEWNKTAHSSWQDFVNANKEIIESVDPGGALLNEVIDARGGFETLSIHENAQERAIGHAQNDINVINQRVNNILKPSELIADAELKDSRVGSNGVIYSSVGEAIRNQISAQDKRLNYVNDLTPFAIRNFMQGGLTIGEGIEVDSTGRVRTSFIEATGGSIIVCPGNEYCYAVLKYDKSRNLINPASAAISDNFMTGSYVVPSGTYFVRIVVANINLLQNDDTKSVDPTTINELGIMITAYPSALESPETVLHQPIPVWAIGSIDHTTGVYVDLNTRIRSAFVRAKYGDIIKLSNHLDYEIKVYEYRSNINGNPLVASGWIAADYSVENQDCCWVKILMRKANGDVFQDTAAGELITLLRSPEKAFPLVTPSASPEGLFVSTNIKYNDTAPVDYNEIINRYDTLMSDHTDYVTKKIIGKDQSNSYDICVYNFLDKQMGVGGIPMGESYNPDTIPTIILDAGMHGFEKPIVSALVNAMDQITNNWVNDPVLAWLHWNFKIIVVPVSNPYGYVNNIRVNYNKVDLNRNFNVTNYFEKGDPTTEHDRYRGSSPLSEKESQYINNLLHDNQDKTWLYLNLHTFGDGSNYNKMTSYEFMPILSTDKIAQAGIETIKTLTLSAWKHHNLNTASGYIGGVGVDELGAMAAGQANEYGIPSAVVEGAYKYYGQNNDWSTDVNLLNTELIINSIIIALRKLYYSNI